MQYANGQAAGGRANAEVLASYLAAIAGQGHLVHALLQGARADRRCQRRLLRRRRRRQRD